MVFLAILSIFLCSFSILIRFGVFDEWRYAAHTWIHLQWICLYIIKEMHIWIIDRKMEIIVSLVEIIQVYFVHVRQKHTQTHSERQSDMHRIQSKINKQCEHNRFKTERRFHSIQFNFFPFSERFPMVFWFNRIKFIAKLPIQLRFPSIFKCACMHSDWTSQISSGHQMMKLIDKNEYWTKNYKYGLIVKCWTENELLKTYRYSQMHSMLG